MPNLLFKKKQLLSAANILGGTLWVINTTQVNRMSRFRRVLSIGGKH